MKNAPEIFIPEERTGEGTEGWPVIELPIYWTINYP